MSRNKLCERVFYGIVELLAFSIVIILVAWFVQSKQQVIEHISPPQVVAVTQDYVDVKWHNQRLLDCPTEGHPAFYTPLATEYLPSRPVASTLQEQKFVRRYFFPEHLLDLHTKNAEPGVVYSAELRIAIIARCNPLWPTTQIVRVPFIMPDYHDE